MPLHEPWALPDARIWLDERETHSVDLDYEDYLHFSRWLWRPKPSKQGTKIYAYRSSPTGASIYLHVEIQKRKGVPPPSLLHTIVDHRNGDSLLCRRANLRWATPSMNRRNLRGCSPRDLMDNE